MSTVEILAELPRLSAEELAKVQGKLDELAGAVWHDHSGLSEAVKTALDAALAEYERDPEAGSTLDELEHGFARNSAHKSPHCDSAHR